ncbi:MAG TPA: MOSC domain-containing protein [Feifaniaceae bacterium]|nr:MOSC domain-containing protein [Feifaniaceae bacterium]
MRTERLTRAVEKGARDMVGKLTLDAEKGVLGDYKSEQDGSVSLLSVEAEREIRQSGGLCTKKFAANIVTSGLDYTLLSVGTRLGAGDTCVLEIERIGKPCYDDCPIHRESAECPLPKNCAFARIKQGGILRAGDELRLLD